MKRSTLFAIVLFSLMFFACSNSQMHSSNSKEVADEIISNEAESADGQQPNAELELTPEVKLIKTGQLDFETKDLNKARASVKTTLKSFGGYITDESSTQGDDHQRYNMTLRVPSSNFDNLFEALVNNENVIHIDNRSVRADDVTEQFIDIEARMKIKKETEKKYSELLGRATKLSDIFEIQGELTKVRTEIEAAEGKLRYLNSNISYSTIEVMFYQNMPESELKPRGYEFFKNMGSAFRGGWDILLEFIVLLTYLWVPIVVLGAVFGVFYYRKRRKK